VASSLYSDITSVKVELEFHNGKNKYFYPRAPASASDDNSELKYSNRILYWAQSDGIVNVKRTQKAKALRGLTPPPFLSGVFFLTINTCCIISLSLILLESNTEHQLVFLQHQYQQLHQENMFYQTCIKNQQQLEELKAKKNPRTPPAEKKNRRTPQATKNNNVSASCNVTI
jgi:gamma-glutamylcysteine synthetase